MKRVYSIKYANVNLFKYKIATAPEHVSFDDIRVQCVLNNNVLNLNVQCTVNKPSEGSIKCELVEIYLTPAVFESIKQNLLNLNSTDIIGQYGFITSPNDDEDTNYMNYAQLSLYQPHNSIKLNIQLGEDDETNIVLNIPIQIILDSVMSK